MTLGSVQRLLSGEWDGGPFVVQILQMPPATECFGKANAMLVEITDGAFRGIVRVASSMTKTLLSHLGKPVLRVTDCEMELVGDTKLLKQRPGWL